MSQTVLDAEVLSTNLLTVVLRQCVPPLCNHPGNTHIQTNTTLQRALISYETGFFVSFTALALSTCNVGT